MRVKAGMFVSNTNIKLKVSTGKKDFSIKWNENEKVLFVETKSNPERGKANKEILKELKRIFGAETYFVTGLTSRQKIVQIDLDEKNLIEKLKKYTN